MKNNFVAKNAKINRSSIHKDRKKAVKSGKFKHKAKALCF